MARRATFRRTVLLRRPVRLRRHTAPSPAVTTAAPLPAPSAPPRPLWSDLKDALAGRPYDHTQGSLHRSVLLLAVPMTLEMVLESVFEPPAATPCVSACDGNADGLVDLVDAVFTLTFLFDNGPVPLGPFPGCGVDPFAGPLPCAASGCP